METVASADPGTRMGRPHMRTGTDAMAVKTAAGPDRSHMRAGMYAAIADTGAGPDDRAGMAARRNPMMVHTPACTDAADMGTGPDAVAPDMGADADAQNLDMRAHGVSRDRRQQCQHTNSGSEHFHGHIPVGRRTETGGPV
jgi:hypothetical protein